MSLFSDKTHRTKLASQKNEIICLRILYIIFIIIIIFIISFQKRLKQKENYPSFFVNDDLEKQKYHI
jgi:hypothetical protein